MPAAAGASPLTVLHPSGYTAVFCRLHEAPRVQEWCDTLREWFAREVFQPLQRKIDTSAMRVNNALAVVSLKMKYRYSPVQYSAVQCSTV